MNEKRKTYCNNEYSHKLAQITKNNIFAIYLENQRMREIEK